MLFNSYEFIFIFLPITFIVYFYLNKKKLIILAKVFLLFSSLFFYSWWNLSYLPLILVSILFNYLVGYLLIKYKKENKQVLRKQLLTFGIIFNIVLLGYFKYADFFITNLNFVLKSNFDLFHIALPLAISFFTFQQIAYLVDSYRHENETYDFLSYGIFISFFPQLIAGPIVHHKEIMPQFFNMKNRVVNYKNVALGLFIFSIGLFKKVIIADTFAVWVNNGFDNANTLTFIEAWVTSYSFVFQVYFDFSGYCDMAIGCALLFNIILPINFYSPYKATSMTEFWNRWHISLTKFINMYIFNPILKLLGKYSFTKALLTILITMIISGLWHGASWLFIIFGIINGIGLIINHFWKKKIKLEINKFLGWFLTFHTFLLSTIFFRAKELDDALKVLKGMFGVNGIILPSFFIPLFGFLENYNIIFGKVFENIYADRYVLLYLLTAFVIVLTFDNSIQIRDKFQIKFKTLIFSVVIFLYSILSLNNISEFIYFNF